MGLTTTRQLVHIRVIKHLPQGLSVEAENGQRGIVRVREISWNDEVTSNWRKHYSIGWKGDALPLPLQKGQTNEFSLRLAEKDPWENLPEEFDKDQIFEGIVTSVVEYGAFVEISPGLTGLLHQSQFPAWHKKPAMNIFWPGDKVFVTILEIDYDQRQVSLGLPPIRHLIEENGLSETATLPIVTREADNDLEKLLEAGAPRRHILVVEDEEPQANAIAGWFRRLGQRVDVVGSAEIAIDFLEKTQPDLALIDVGLPEMSGTGLAQHILEKYPQVEVANATDWAHANDILDTLETLRTQGAKLLLKPLLPEDLVGFLLQDQRQQQKHIKTEGTGEDKLTLSDIPKLSANKSAHSLLNRCRKRLDFELAILFSLDPNHRRAAVVERSGDGIINKSAIPYLIYSPVRDVAEDRDAVVVDEIDEHEHSRFRYLLELCPIAVSCIGVPVPTQMPFDYALFVLDKRARQITNEQQIYVEGIALAIGASLDQNELMEKSVLMQRTALIGHLTRAMMHEINNLVGPLLYEADSLKKNLTQIEKESTSPAYKSINDEIAKIQQDVRKIIKTTKTFGRIVAKGKEETLRVDEIILETLNLLKDMSDRAHVIMRFTLPEHMVVARIQAAILEQIFLNVTLNAIQQISELRPKDGGWIKINMEVEESQNNTICRILIEDNGPGIHASLWEKIFEAGFTTRHDGSGIGLYISRNLMEDLGGRLFVLESRILSGTTFAMEVPIHI